MNNPTPVEIVTRFGLQDLASCFEIQEDLYAKYVVPELFEDSYVLNFLLKRDKIYDWKVQTPLGGPGTILNGAALYCLIRHYNLKTVFETGVSGGFFLFLLLKALEKNQGILESVELGNNDHVGCLIDKPFPDHWNLHTGIDSVKFLKENNIQVDMYCHDSLHTLSHMLKELMYFKRCEKERFLVYIDDQESDNFWSRCVQANNFQKKGYAVKYISGKESRLGGHLGGFLKFEKIEVG